MNRTFTITQVRNFPSTALLRLMLRKLTEVDTQVAVVAVEISTIPRMDTLKPRVLQMVTEATMDGLRAAAFLVTDHLHRLLRTL